MRPAGTTVGRLVVDPFTEKLDSTWPEEFAAIESLFGQGWNLVAAIDWLVARNTER